MGVETVQSNMTAGVLAPELHARVDIEKYQHGVSVADNMVIMPFGGLRRRPGMQFITHLTTETRIEAFVFNTTQKYLIAIQPLKIDIYRDDVLVSTETTPYADITTIRELDIIQSADTMIFVHGSHPPYQLQRQGSDTVWDMSPVVFTAYPYKLFGASVVATYKNDGLAQTVNLAIDDIVLDQPTHKFYRAKVARSSIDLATDDYTNTTNWSLEATQEIAWSATRGYPISATFHGGRLFFGGATQSPTTIWGSKINGFFDFSLGRGEADEGIEDILDTDQYNIIQNIFSGRSLQVFTSGGEFYNSATNITPALSSWVRSTGYGNTKIRPIFIDGTTIYIDSSKRTVRQFLYDYNEDGYVSLNASLLSSHLITRVVAMSSIKGTQHDVGDYVYIVNEDGTMAVLNTMRLEKITGWTKWTTDGIIEDVVVIVKDVYLVVLRNGERFLEKLQEETYTDHNVLYLGTPTSMIVTNYHQSMLNTNFKVVADFSIMPDAKPIGVDGSNYFEISRTAERLEVGLNFTTNVTTLPISTETQKGITLHRRKRVVKVDINVMNSLGVYANNRFSSDRQFTIVLDKAPIPFTGFKEMYLLGYNRLTQIEITQKEPLPLTIRAVAFEIAY